MIFATMVPVTVAGNGSAIRTIPFRANWSRHYPEFYPRKFKFLPAAEPMQAPTQKCRRLVSIAKQQCPVRKSCSNYGGIYRRTSAYTLVEMLRPVFTPGYLLRKKPIVTGFGTVTNLAYLTDGLFIAIRARCVSKECRKRQHCSSENTIFPRFAQTAK